MSNQRAMSRWAETKRGWPALLGCAVGVSIGSSALPFYTAGVFVPALEAEFGWSRTQLSFAAFVAPLTVALCAPLAGSLIDRFGVRLPAAIGMLGLVAAFSGFSVMSGNFALYMCIQIAMSAMNALSSPIAYTWFINDRFHVARGLALGLILSAIGISGFLGPIIVGDIIATHGWRAAYVRLAMFVFAAIPVMLMLLTLSLRRDASSITIDREAAEAALPAAAAVPLRRVLQGGPFARLFAIFFILAMGVSGFVLHLVPMLVDAGIDPRIAAATQARLGFAVIVGRLATGILVDYFFAPRVAAVSLSFTVAGLIALAVLGDDVAPWSALAIGFALGAEVDLIGYLTARYFGMAVYGRVFGLLYGAFVVGTGLSPLVIARIEALAGSYVAPLWASSVFVATAILLLLLLPRFKDESVPA